MLHSKYARVLDNFPDTVMTNYQTAIAQLQELFERELLVQIYVRYLIIMVIRNIIFERINTIYQLYTII